VNPRLKIRRDSTPLFDFAEAKQRAERKRDVGIERGAEGAEHVDPGFAERALVHVERYARTHPGPFLAEEIRAGFETGAVDGRAWGGIMAKARARGLIESDGFALANSSNRSPKCAWRSKVYEA